MIFFDLDGTLLDHKSSELHGVEAFYEEYKDLFRFILQVLVSNIR
jgi:putative hydrolase of the HAD superfamily